MGVGVAIIHKVVLERSIRRVDVRGPQAPKAQLAFGLYLNVVFRFAGGAFGNLLGHQGQASIPGNCFYTFVPGWGDLVCFRFCFDLASPHLVFGISP